MKKISFACFICFSLLLTGAASAQNQPEGGSTIDPPPAASAPAGNPCGTDAACNAALAQCRTDLNTSATAASNLVTALAACQGNLKKTVPVPPPVKLPPPPECLNGGVQSDKPDSVAIIVRGKWVCVATDEVYRYIAGLRQDVNRLQGQVPDWQRYKTLVDNLTVLLGQPGSQFSSQYANLFAWQESAEARLQRIAEIDRWINESLLPWMAMHDQAINTLCPAVASCGATDFQCRCEQAAKKNQGTRVDFSLGARGLLMHRPSAGVAGGIEGYAELEVRIPNSKVGVLADVGVGIIGDSDTGTQFTTSQTIAIRGYFGEEERTSLDFGPSFRQYFSTHSAGYQGVLQDKGMGMEIDGRLQLRHCFTAAACLGLGGYLGGSPTTNYFPQPGEVARDKGFTGGGFLSVSGVVTKF
ncbi:MAG: hypothetical protein RDU25_02500 [Patescibacteria group bacterium]|nr:hypothetical protein [Patescibacteria group bacterium]